MPRIPTVLFFCSLAAASADGAPAELRYNRDIRPILSDHCFACHGPDKNHREADLRLDVREAAIEAKALVPGDPKASLLLERLHTTDEDDLMPPPEFKKPLTAAQKEVIETWIRQGAEYEPHWAYTPLVRPPAPAPGHPVDAFLRAKLAELGADLSPPANARTLIRRLSLDLTGLPPAPTEVNRFLADHARDPVAAVDALISRLFASPQFGERWAVWWLDVARFADTVGFHGDQNQRIFPYRDYVIAAFNSNKGFDQFTLEQLAGDLLPNPTPEQLVATGFNRLNMMTREGGAQPKEYLAKYQADRVRTVGGTWLGATLGCAECHDHKFDPFTMRDFYSLSAYFADIKQFGVYASYGYTPNEELKGWTNDHPFPPEIEVESPYQRERLNRLRGRMAATALEAWQQAIGGANGRAVVQGWLKRTRDLLMANPGGWHTPKPEATTSIAKGGKAKAKTDAPAARASVLEDGSVLLEGEGPQDTVLTLRPGATRVAAIRLELLPDSRHGGRIELGGTSEGLSLSPVIRIQQPGTNAELNPAFRHAEADRKLPRFAGTEEIAGIQGGWKTPATATDRPHTGVWLLDQPVELAAGSTLTLRLSGHRAGRLRIALSPLAPLQPLDDPAPLATLFEHPDLNKPDARLAQIWLTQSGQDRAALAQWKALFQEALACREGKAWTQVTVALKDPMPVRVLPRGNWMDESGALQQPAPPEFLTGPPAPGAPRQTRLDLARWLTSAENPLTARTFVNRLWKQFFGQGLSSAVDDLGAQGETPSHPELLDWLACEFRDSGWDVQHLMRRLVTSAAYQQDSRARPELREKDPDNRRLAFQNPRRLDAEFVRDNALFAAGLLNLDLGGPSVKPYQPPGYYDNLQFPSRDYLPNTDDRQWRRGLYMHWQRTFLHPMLANFDAPARDECTASRTVSNTPQQALTLLNDPTFVEASRVFAESLTGSDTERLEQVFLRLLARPPTEKERTSLLTFLAGQRDAWRAVPEDAQKLLATGLRPLPQGDPAELAAWTSLCRVVLNLHETITRY